jgi:hypothetical protein
MEIGNQCWKWSLKDFDRRSSFPRDYQTGHVDDSDKIMVGTLAYCEPLGSFVD